MSWLFTKKNNYIPVLELLLVLLSVWPLNSHAKSSLCEVGVSSELMLESQRLEQALPGAAFNLSESKVNKAFLNTEGSYTRLSQSQIVEVFPTENTYRIVEKDSKLFLIFAVYSKVEKFRRIKVIPLESKNSSLTCSKVVKYKKLLDEQTALLQNSLHIYSGKNPHGTFGASLINLESLRYQSEKTQYPTKTMLTAYNEILEVVKELLHSDRSLLGGIETIRQVLIERGFEGYCRNNISFLDFIQKGCTNCQGQTMLVLSLAMDAHLKKDETWELGFQVFSDHIAPVLYDSNENIIDLIYATKAKDTGDPVFKAEKLMMFALKMSKERLGPNAQEKIKSESRKRAENFSYKNLFKSIFIRPITTLLSAPSLDEAVPLFDLSGIMAVSSFSPELPPETATLNLSGSLLNPLEKSKHSGIDTLFGKMFDSSDNYSEFGGQGNNSRFFIGPVNFR